MITTPQVIDKFNKGAESFNREELSALIVDNAKWQDLYLKKHTEVNQLKGKMVSVINTQVTDHEIPSSIVGKPIPK